jgi:hypothetical protein
VLYAGPQSVAEKAVAEFEGMVIGGQIVSATTKLSSEGSSSETSADAAVLPGDKQDSGPPSESSGEKRKPSGKDDAATLKKPRTDEPTPLYSGDKLIPERFAECKRVAKVPSRICQTCERRTSEAFAHRSAGKINEITEESYGRKERQG